MPNKRRQLIPPWLPTPPAARQGKQTSSTSPHAPPVVRGLSLRALPRSSLIIDSVGRGSGLGLEKGFSAGPQGVPREAGHDARNFVARQPRMDVNLHKKSGSARVTIALPSLSKPLPESRWVKNREECVADSIPCLSDEPHPHFVPLRPFSLVRTLIIQPVRGGITVLST